MFGEEYQRGAEKFTLALQHDELNLDANCGSLECAIQMAGEGPEGTGLDEAANQLMFLEVRGRSGFGCMGVQGLSRG